MTAIVKSKLNQIHSKLDWHLRRSERIFLEAVQRWFAVAINRIQADLTRKFAKDVVTELTDWAYIEEQGQQILKPAMMSIMQTGADFGQRLFQVKGAFDIVNLESVKAAETHTAHLVREVTAQTKKGIRVYITASVKEGKSMDKVAREIRPLIGLTQRQTESVMNYKARLSDKEKYPTLSSEDIDKRVRRYADKTRRRRAQTIARTETARAQNLGYVQGLQEIGLRRLEFSAYPGCCDVCAAMDGKEYPISDAAGLIPVHPNCLTGDSLVTPRGRITSVSKRRYNGQIQIIKTATNRVIRCTPNHPVLTDGGFVPAYSLDIGSQIISHGFGKRERFRDWYDINKPTPIEDIAESFFQNRFMLTEEVPVSTPDFHGDGFGSKIAIISTDGLLVNRCNAPAEQHILQNEFVLRKIGRSLFNRFCMLALGKPTDFSAQGGLVSSLKLFFSLIRAHLRPLESFRLALVPNVDVGIHQSLPDITPAAMEAQSDLVFRPSGNVQTDDVAGFFVDTVVHVCTSKLNGYVYNLETTESYYIVNGVASHNCRCAILPVVEGMTVATPAQAASAIPNHVEGLRDALRTAKPKEAKQIQRALRKLGQAAP